MPSAKSEKPSFLEWHYQAFSGCDPREVKKLNLRLIDGQYFLSEKFPFDFAEFYPNLEEIVLSGKGLTGVPSEIFKCKGLKNLNLRNNKLTKIPEGVRNLKGLETLIVSENMIREIPAFISELENLEQFFASYNSIAVVPKEVTDFFAEKDVFVFLNDNNLLRVDLRNKYMGDVCNEGFVKFDRGYGPKQKEIFPERELFDSIIYNYSYPYSASRMSYSRESLDKAYEVFGLSGLLKYNETRDGKLLLGLDKEILEVLKNLPDRNAVHERPDSPDPFD